MNLPLRAPASAPAPGLCTLHFVAVGAGDAAIEFARASVRDGYNRILDSRFDPARITVR